MRAVVLGEYGDTDVLRVVEVAEPTAGPEEVVVEVVATALNRSWSEPRVVSITLNDGRPPFTGHFQGIDDHGRLRLATAGDGVRLYDATEVSLLREIA